jgi:hypothetical protein
MANYFVIGPDGSKYGPADVATLSKWADENRLTAATMLENADTHEQAPAGSIDGIIKPEQQTAPTYGASVGPTYSAPGPTYTPYGRVDPQMQPQNTDGLIVAAWILGSISLFTCICTCLGPLLVGGGGIACAAIAKSKGNPKAQAPLVFSICMTALGVVLWIVYFIVMMQMGSNGRPWYTGTP